MTDRLRTKIYKPHKTVGFAGIYMTTDPHSLEQWEVQPRVSIPRYTIYFPRSRLYPRTEPELSHTLPEDGF